MPRSARAEKVFASTESRSLPLHAGKTSAGQLGNVIVPYHYAVTSRSNEVVTIPKAASPQNRMLHESAGDDEHESVNTIS